MKKTISLLLILISFINLIPSVSMARGKTDLTENELGLLYALSVLNDEALSENAVLTRGEYAEVICRLFKWNNYTSAEIPFQDIDESHPHYGAISALYAKGAIKGVTKYAVAPDRSITVDEAAVIAVNALGFNIVYETGEKTYYSQAVELGLYDGIAHNPDEEITEEMATRMMYNILFSPIVTYGMKDGGTSYSYSDDVIMLNEIYDVYETEGIMKQNGITSFFGVSSIREDEVMINDTIYKSVIENADELFGYAVVGYVEKDSDDEYSLIYAYADNKENNTVEILSDDIIYGDKTVIRYGTENGKVETVKLSLNTDVIYNGIGIDNITDATFQPGYGKIKLVDYDDDKLYDVAFITEYQLAVVAGVTNSTSKLVIADKLGNSFSANYNAIDVKINVYSGSSIAAVSDIKTGAVILIADSGERNSKRIVNIDILRDKISGAVKSVGDETVTVDSKEVKLASVANRETITAAFGRTADIYLDNDGRAVYGIVAYGTKYGYLFKIRRNDDEEKIEIKLLDTDNVWQTYPLREKVKCNGDTHSMEYMYDILSNSSAINGTNMQMIRYELSAEGEISRLDIALSKTDKNGLIDKSYDEQLREKGYFRKSMLKAERRFGHTFGGMFETKGYSSWMDCLFAGGMPLLVMPDPDTVTNIEQDDLKFTTSSYFRTDYDYVCEGYDLSDDYRIAIMIAYGDTTPSVKIDDRVVVVDKIVTELNDDDEPVKVLYGWYQGTCRAFKGLSENSFEYGGSDVSRGDVIRLAKNDDGEVSHVEPRLYFRVDGNPQRYFTTYQTGDRDSSGEYSDAYAYSQSAVGVVDKVNGDFLRIAIRDGRYINVKMRSDASYIIYDEEGEETISAGTMNDVTVGDYVVARLYVGNCKDIIIFRL